MSLFNELKRRNVFRIALFYIVSAWVVIQVAETVLPLFDVPDAALRAVVVILALGFPLALVFAWVFELTPEGLRREKDVDVSPATKQQTAHKLNWATLIAAVLAIGLIVVDRMLPENATSGDIAKSAPSADSATSAAADAPLDKSIAVLPFSDFSPDGDSQWFADGLIEEILNSLVRVPDLLVAARTSSFNFRDSTLPIPEIAAELGVAHVLAGSVRMGGDRVRVTAQLIRAADGFHVWSDTFDRQMADMISIQEDLAREIAEAMETTMDPAALAEMTEVGTQSVEAYQAYIRGRAIEQFGGNPEAHELFEEARSIDPGFAEAHYRAARFWQYQSNGAVTGLVYTGLTHEEMAGRFNERISAAIESVSSEAERVLYRGLQALFQLRLRDAKALFEAYVLARPGDSEAWLELIELAEMVGDEALVLRGIRVLEPMAETEPNIAEKLPYLLYRRSDPETALAEVQRTIPLIDRWPQNADVHYQLHRALLWVGEVETARRIHDRIFRAGLDIPNSGLVRLRQACAENRLGAARTIFEQEIGNSRNERWLALLLMGQPEAATELLQPLEETGKIYALSSYLAYPHFDPRRYPSVMRVLEAEQIAPRELRPNPFACRFEADTETTQ